MNINHFIISGNITRDLELRQLPSGIAVVNFTVACNFVRFDDDGKKHERADFIPVTTFGKQAERDSKYLHKGSAVTVEGRMESWFDPEARRGGFNFIARNVEYGNRATNGDDRKDEAPSQGDDEWVRSYDDVDRTRKSA